MVITNDLYNRIYVTSSLQEKGGKYYAVLQYKDKDGKKQYKWKTTKIKVERGNKKNAQRIAEEIRQQFELELNAPATAEAVASDNNYILFGNYMLEWLKKQKSKVELSTYSGYEHNVKKTAEYFNNLGITIQELKTKHIQEFYDYLQATYNIKWNTVKRYHANIHKALEDAIRLELINNNPASHIQHNKVKQYIANYYNKEELKQLFEIAKGDLIEPIILVTAYYGLRKEETLGLKWDAIDFINKTITIKHTVTNASVDGKRVIVKKDRTKNQSSYRTLHLIPDIEKLLLKEKTKQEDNKKYFGGSYKNKDNYIFVNEEGDLIKPDRVSRRFRQLLRDNNLRHIRFHDLRHSCASLLLANNANMKQIQMYLGHSSYNTTANIYSHLETDTNVVLATTIANAFCPSK